MCLILIHGRDFHYQFKLGSVRPTQHIRSNRYGLTNVLFIELCRTEKTLFYYQNLATMHCVANVCSPIMSLYVVQHILASYSITSAQFFKQNILWLYSTSSTLIDEKRIAFVFINLPNYPKAFFTLLHSSFHIQLYLVNGWIDLLTNYFMHPEQTGSGNV